MASLIENANRLSQAKTDIKQVIKNKGIIVPDSATIDTYPDIIGNNLHNVSKVTATAPNVLKGKVIVDANGNELTGTMNDYSTSTMPRNGTTSAITDITDQWSTGMGYGADMQFKLNFSGYVTPNTTVNQAVYGLHPAVIKKGHLIGGNGSAGGVGALTGTYEGMHIYNMSCDVSAGTWYGKTLSDSSWVDLCNSNGYSTWRYYFDKPFDDLSKIQFVAASFAEPTNGIRITRGYASSSTTPQYQYIPALSVWASKGIPAGIQGYMDVNENGFVYIKDLIIDNYSESSSSSSQAYMLVRIYKDYIFFGFQYDGRTLGHIKSTTPQFIFTIGYTD